jgi:hypothetical protein
MAVTYKWASSDKKIMIYSFEDPWEWPEYFALRPQSDAEISALSHKVGVIINIPRNLALGASALSQGSRIMNTKPANLDLMVVVTENGMYKTFLKMFLRVFRSMENELVQRDTVEEAVKLLEDRLR